MFIFQSTQKLDGGKPKPKTDDELKQQFKNARDVQKDADAPNETKKLAKNDEKKAEKMLKKLGYEYNYEKDEWTKKEPKKEDKKEPPKKEENKNKEFIKDNDEGTKKKAPKIKYHKIKDEYITVKVLSTIDNISIKDSVLKMYYNNLGNRESIVKLIYNMDSRSGAGSLAIKGLKITNEKAEQILKGADALMKTFYDSFSPDSMSADQKIIFMIIAHQLALGYSKEEVADRVKGIEGKDAKAAADLLIGMEKELGAKSGIFAYIREIAGLPVSQTVVTKEEPKKDVKKEEKTDTKKDEMKTDTEKKKREPDGSAVNYEKTFSRSDTTTKTDAYVLDKGWIKNLDNMTTNEQKLYNAVWHQMLGRGWDPTKVTFDKLDGIVKSQGLELTTENRLLCIWNGSTSLLAENMRGEKVENLTVKSGGVRFWEGNFKVIVSSVSKDVKKDVTKDDKTKDVKTDVKKEETEIKLDAGKYLYKNGSYEVKDNGKVYQGDKEVTVDRADFKKNATKVVEPVTNKDDKKETKEVTNSDVAVNNALKIILTESGKISNDTDAAAVENIFKSTELLKGNSVSENFITKYFAGGKKFGDMTLAEFTNAIGKNDIGNPAVAYLLEERVIQRLYKLGVLVPSGKVGYTRTHLKLSPEADNYLGTNQKKQVEAYLKLYNMDTEELKAIGDSAGAVQERVRLLFGLEDGKVLAKGERVIYFFSAVQTKQDIKGKDSTQKQLEESGKPVSIQSIVEGNDPQTAMNLIDAEIDKALKLKGDEQKTRLEKILNDGVGVLKLKIMDGTMFSFLKAPYKKQMKAWSSTFEKNNVTWAKERIDEIIAGKNAQEVESWDGTGMINNESVFKNVNSKLTASMDWLVRLGEDEQVKSVDLGENKELKLEYFVAYAKANPTIYSESNTTAEGIVMEFKNLKTADKAKLETALKKLKKQLNISD